MLKFSKVSTKGKGKKMKKLPIGIQTFQEIIEENHVYVDKTDIAFRLINEGKYYFLSRPRRFGKSMFLDTLRTIFEGKKELFEGLAIYDKYDWSKTYPVIRISFNDGISKTKEDLQQRIYELLDFNQRHLGISCPENFSLSGCFKRLIEEAYTKYNQKVVILVDEYDKPILDNIENTEIATIMRDELKSFYSVIKGADEYLKFVFITGVSKFSKVSLFSGLNNLQDITLNANFATICGYTQSDIEHTFKDRLAGADMAKVKEWYNGYKWLGEGVYNPFGFLSFLSNDKTFQNYWFSTATPTFLLKLIEKNRYFLPNLESIIQNEQMLSNFDVDCIELETLMWQTGYLTIESREESFSGMLYHLAIPNKEVRLSLLCSIADFMSKIQNSQSIKTNLYKALTSNDFEALQKAFTSLFAAIAYNNFTGAKLYEYEGYYASVAYAYLASLGFVMAAEDVTNKGRIDLTVKLPNAVFIFEFKTDTTGALAQIKSKNYHEKYLCENKPIYLVGIEFSSEKRNIEKFEWEMV